MIYLPIRKLPLHDKKDGGCALLFPTTIHNHLKEYPVYRVRANRYTVRYIPYGILLRAKPHTRVLVKMHSTFDKLNITEYNESHLYHGYTVRYNHGDNVIYPVR